MSFCLRCGKETKNNTKFCSSNCANKYNAKIQSETQKNKSPEEKLKILEKKKQTSLKNWGTESPMQSDIVKDKLKQSNLRSLEKEAREIDVEISRLDVKLDYMLNRLNEEYRQKCKETNLEHHGKEWYTQTEEFKEKSKQSIQNKYGVDNASQSLWVQSKKHYKYFYDNLKFDSSWELAFYIYHKDNGYKIEREPCKFKYTYKNKIHYYFPDFRIDDKLYEIKGRQFLNKKTGEWINFYGNRENDDELEAKHQCALQNGVEIIYNCLEYIKYVNEKYGKDFIKSCKHKN